MTPRFEYSVTKGIFYNDPDVKKEQAEVDRMAAEGWRLVAVLAVSGGSGVFSRGSTSFFWERPV